MAVFEAMGSNKKLWLAVAVLSFLCVVITPIYPIPRTPIEVGYFASNELGQNLGSVETSELDQYEFFIERIIEDSQGTSRTISTFLYTTIPERTMIHETREQYDQSGARTLKQIWVSGVMHESWEFLEQLPIRVMHINKDGSELTYINQFSNEGLVHQEIRVDDISHSERRFIHSSDGSLHGLIDEHLATGERSFLIISDTGTHVKDGAPNIGRIAYGTAQDFTVIHTYPNGNEVSQSWSSDDSPLQSGSNQVDENGLLTIKEYDTTTSLTTFHFYDAEGRLVRRLTERTDQPDASWDIRYFYDESGRLAEEIADLSRKRERTIYRYASNNALQEKILYRDGVMVSRTVFHESTIEETVFKKGIPYMRTLFELDGVTVKESSLVK